MTDIIDLLKEPEAHHPGNFDTPKRANAMLSCLCQDAAEEIERLRKQLSEVQDRERKLLGTLQRCVRYGGLFLDVVKEATAVIAEVAGVEKMKDDTTKKGM